MMRLEYKYLVHKGLLDVLRKAMLPYLDYDSFAQEREKKEYTVRSIYLDTPEMDYYYEKVEGLKVRKKLRIRGYNELFGEKVVFLEIKRKYSSYNSKNRSPILYGDLPELFETGNIEDLVLTNKKNDNPLKDGKRFFFHYHKKSLRPTVLVVYEREAFFVKLNSTIRITFDKNLRFLAFPSIHDLYDEDNLRYAMPKYFILELKSNQGFPLWLRNLIHNYNLERMAVSKYSTCLEANYRLYPAEKYMKKSYHNSLLEEKIYQEIVIKHAAGFSKYY